MLFARRLLCFALAGVLVSQTHHIISACQFPKESLVTIRKYSQETDVYRVSHIIKDNYQHLLCSEGKQKERKNASYTLISECLHAQKNSSLVLLVTGEIAGFVVFRPEIFKDLQCPLRDQWKGYIQLIAVDKKYRKRGFGKMLLESAQEKLQEAGHASFFLHSHNQDSFSFYRRCGFQLLDQQVSPGQCTTWYKKNEPNSSWHHVLHSLSSAVQMKPSITLLSVLVIAYLSYSYV